MSELDKYLKEVRARVEAGTPGRLIGNFSKHITEVKDEVVAAIVESIDSSIAHDGGHPWYWLETENHLQICATGCGPTSRANMELFGHSPTDLTKLVKICEVLSEGLSWYAGHDPEKESAYFRAGLWRNAENTLKQAEELCKQEEP